MSADGTFASFLHSRPFASGRWRLSGTTLTLEASRYGNIVVTGLTRQGDTIQGTCVGRPTTWQAHPLSGHSGRSPGSPGPRASAVIRLQAGEGARRAARPPSPVTLRP